MERFSVIALLVVAISVDLTVFGQDPQIRPNAPRRGAREKRMKQLDANSDGAISRGEWKGKPQVFDRIDKNGDQSLSLEEMRAAAPRKGARVNQMDANNDQRISREEWQGAPKRFERLDANGDGMITKEELRSARRKRP